MRPACKQILNRDPGRVPTARGHLHLFGPGPEALLCLDGLMEPIPPAAALGRPARKLVNDHDLAVANHILPVAGEEVLRPQGSFYSLVHVQQP